MIEGPLTRWMLRLGTAFVLVFIYFPLAVIGLYAFNDDITQAWPIQNWTTKWFEVAFHDPEVRDAFLLSVKAATFATLIAQSAELGSSITEALRVYSDDMRHKRLSRAEEKAYALPAKLSVPMMVCIFPVLFVVILLPVFVRLHVGNY